jgi:hypothetical protein
MVWNYKHSVNGKRKTGDEEKRVLRTKEALQCFSS